MATARDDLRLLERMFQLSDKDRDGRLSVEEFSDLLRLTNPDATLDASHLELIVEHVWTQVAQLASLQAGLEFEGLMRIYESGLADIRRDYEYVSRAYEEERAREEAERMSREEQARREAEEKMQKIVMPNKGFSFVVHVGGDGHSDVTKEDVRKALIQKAMPEGILELQVHDAIQTYPGKCFDVLCIYNDSDASIDAELEYVKTVMEVEPQQAFPESQFGDSVTVSLFRETKDVDDSNWRASELFRTTILMGSPGYSSFAFAIEMDDYTMTGESMLASLECVLPRGASSMISRDERLGSGKRVITIGSRVPVAKGRVARDLIQSLQGNIQAIFPECTNANLMAAQAPQEHDSVLVYRFSLNNSCDMASLAQDVRSMLPAGSVTSVSDASVPNNVCVVASIPKDYSKHEVEACKDAPKRLKEWCRSFKDVGKVCVSDGCSMFDCSQDQAGAFGIPLEEQYPIQEYDKQGDIPDHDGPLRLEDSDDEGIDFMSPPKQSLIAGYQRRSPSTSGSSGLVEALDNVQLEVTSPTVVEEKEVKSQSAVISVHAYPSNSPAITQKEPSTKPLKQQQRGWKNFLKSLSPSKKKQPADLRGENTGIEDDAKDVVQLPISTEMSKQGEESFEEREHMRHMAIMDANIRQIVAQADFLIHSNPENLGKALEPVHNGAMLLPSWACHAACMEVAEILIKASHYEEAREFLVEATQAMPENAVAYFRLGNTFFGLNDYDTAARHYYEAIKRSDKHDVDFLSKVHINMGIALESLGNLPAAEREYVKAAEMANDHHRIHKLLGSVRYALGQYEGAADALEHALRIVPDFADAWTDLGCVRIALGNKKEAVRCFKMALASEEDNLEAHFNLGNLLRETSKPKESIQHYDFVLAQDPSNALALLGKAVALSMLAENSPDCKYRREAVQCLRKCIDLCKEDDALVIEIQRLCKLVKQSATHIQISNQLSVIEDVFEEGGQPHTPREAATSADTRATDTSDAKCDSRPSRASDVPSQATMSRTVSMQSIQSGVHITDRSFDRLSQWNPPRQISKSDFSAQVVDAIEGMLGQDSVDHVLTKVDVNLLQTLQPLTTLTFESLKILINSPKSRSNSPSKQSKSKIVRKIHADDLLEILDRLIRPRSPRHLTELAMSTLQRRIFPILDVEGNGFLNFGIVVAMLAIFVDAPGRERLGYAYRLLMSRTANSTTGESLITRADSIEYMASLKAAFEREHNKRLLVQVCDSNQNSSLTQGSRFVMYEKFSKDIETFFGEFEAFPLLCNPLN